jgi:hypothetical protein
MKAGKGGSHKGKRTGRRINLGGIGPKSIKAHMGMRGEVATADLTGDPPRPSISHTLSWTADGAKRRGDA